jgi:hypothetical protein
LSRRCLAALAAVLVVALVGAHHLATSLPPGRATEAASATVQRAPAPRPGPELPLAAPVPRPDPAETGLDLVTVPDPAEVGGDAVIPPPPERFEGPPAPPGPPPVQLAHPHPATPQDGVWAVIIGIDDYPGRSADLEYAVADADAIDLALSGFGVSSDRRLVLRDGQATRAQVLGAMSWLVDRAGPDATAVVFFAGHVRHLGGSTQAMITAEGATITDAELAVRLGALSARHTWIAVAACYGGGFTELLAPGRVLTAAAGADSLAYESRDIRGSYLVHHMVREGWLQGLAGPSVQDAFRYADEALAATHPHRRPVQFDHAWEPVSFGPMPVHAASSEHPPPASPPSGAPSSSEPPLDPEPQEPGDDPRPPPGMRRPVCLICG